MLQGSDSDSKDRRLSPRPEERRVPIPDHTLLRVIGQGSYGQVWLARTLTGSYRAVKVVRKTTREDERGFAREFHGIQNYEPISRRHPSLVDILQVGRGEDFFYYVMELADNAAGLRAGTEAGGAGPGVPGTGLTDPEGYVADTLKLRLQLDGRLPSNQWADLGLALTDALAQLHERGLVHRDVKPSNVIYVRGEPKLTDIGLVTRAGTSHSLVGTVGYIPPEGPGSMSADLFSLGRVLYQASSGLGPDAYPEPPTDLGPNEIELWAELNEIILRACGPKPQDRYASSREMHQDLERLKAGASLRRLRRTERRLAMLKKVAAVSLLLTLLIAAGLLIQIGEARRARQSALENQLRLRHAYLAEGVRAMDEGDQSTALVWLTEALKLTPPASGRAVLSGTNAPPDEDFQRSRWESILRQCPRLVRLGAHEGPVVTARFSPDGRTLLTASVDGSACLWRTDTGELAFRLPHNRPLTYAAFSGDGAQVVTCCEDGAARVWDTVSGQLRFAPLQHEAKVLHAAFSADNQRLVTCGADGTARLWDAASGECLAIPLKTEGDVNYTEFSPDGRWFVTASDDKTARFWDAHSGIAAGPVLQHHDHVRQARFSPDGRSLVTASRDGYARIFDIQSGRLQAPPLPHAVPLLYAAFSPDGGRVIAGGASSADTDGEVRVWDAATGQPISRPRFINSRSVTSVFSPDGCLVATVTHARRVFLWDVETGRQVAPPLSHGQSVWDACFSADGHQLASASRDGAWRIWDLAIDTAADPVWRHSQNVRRATFTRNGRRVLVSGETGDSGLWDPATGVYSPLSAPGLGREVFAQHSPSRKYIVAYYESGRAAVHDGADGHLLAVLNGCEKASHVPCFSPDETRLLVASEDNVAHFWRTESGELVGPTLVHHQMFRCGAFSPDGEWVATGAGPAGEKPGHGSVQVWSASTGALRYPALEVDGTPVLAISPNGKWLLIGANDPTARRHFAQLHHLDSGQPAGRLWWHTDGISAVAFTPDGRRAVTTGEDGACRVWDVETGHAVTPWLQHRRGVNSLSFAPDGRRMVTASSDGDARIWDVLTGEPLSPPLLQLPWLHCASFDHEGLAVVTGGEDRTARIWRLPVTNRSTGELEAIAQLQAGRRLDNTGGLSPLAPAELQNLWGALARGYPTAFTTSDSAILAWRRAQASAHQAAHRWNAARFHLEWILRLHPSDEAARHQLTGLEGQAKGEPSR